MSQSSHYFIGIAGNIGVGKTTLTEIIADHFKWTPYFESVVDNPYLTDFYDNMTRWSFHLQVYFLAKRFQSHHEIHKGGQSIVQDRTIYEDVEIFAYNLHKMGNMSDRDYHNYRELFKGMIPFLRKPDLLVYLQASTDTLISRIRKRGRDYERRISPEYLHQLNIAYERWIKKISREVPVHRVNADKFDMLTDQAQLDILLDTIAGYCAPDLHASGS
jgi:deoxyadenosine/deoxycytidine kinase